MNRKGADVDRRYMRDKSQVPPKPVVRLGLAILRGVNWIQNSIVPAPMRIADLSFGGYTLSEVVRTAAALGIADKLAQGPMTAEALADDIGADPERLFRLMRFATVHGIFKISRASRRQQGPATTLFANNALSACLREDHPNSQKHLILAVVGKQHLSAGWQELEWGIRTKGRIFEKVYGEAFFERCANDMAIEDTYSKGMSALDHTCGNTILQDYAWGKYAHYVDIAGAYGSFIAELLKANPKSTGVLFDQSQVIHRARKVWQEDASRLALAGRISFVAGDFFKPETLPCAQSKKTAWILRQICHDWPDEETVRILSSIRAAMEPHPQECTLCLVEAVITSKGEPTADVRDRARTASDLHMMIQHDGKERDALQWADILSKAGFKLTKIVSTRSVFSIVEASPVPITSSMAVMDATQAA
ncbi:g8219 [Coccomyxa viridis]|uniref:G8219 protein n=1 Tax=Coccomyxa viridis TaxID=1274662 RepID=A0ABP1G6J8_9CHLO